MKITAAVVRERGGAFGIEQLDLCDPRADELLVDVVASGMCATDLHGRDAYYPTKFPKVFGHEGAGVVRAVGAGVSKFKPGDHVVMAYPWCGECENCKTHRQTYCLHAFDLKMNGTRADGSTLHSKDGEPIYSAFFQQSSFGNFTIANERFAVKVRNDVPLTSVCALACGGQTGAGAVLNVMKPQAGDSFVVFGVGAVGLSGLMSAKIAGCDPIIAVDVHEHRLKLARELGATHTINHTGRTDVVEELQENNGTRRPLHAGNLGDPLGLSRSGRCADAGRHLRAARQRAQRHRSDASRRRFCRTAAPCAASSRATACRRSSSRNWSITSPPAVSRSNA